MSPEAPCRREFSQFVPDHVLGNKNLHVNFAVVHHERVPHEFGDNGARPGPRCDGFFATRIVLFVDLGVELRVDVRSLF